MSVGQRAGRGHAAARRNNRRDPCKCGPVVSPARAFALAAFRPRSPPTLRSPPKASLAAAERSVIGHSVQGRPIVACRSGEPGRRRQGARGRRDPRQRDRRDADRAAADRGRRAARRRALGRADDQPRRGRRRHRGNAHGVDLNRNFSYDWAPLTGGEYSGTGPLSEPESRAARRLILQIRPDVTIWFHQPFGIVDRPPRPRSSPSATPSSPACPGPPSRPLPRQRLALAEPHAAAQHRLRGRAAARGERRPRSRRASAAVRALAAELGSPALDPAQRRPAPAEVRPPGWPTAPIGCRRVEHRDDPGRPQPWRSRSRSLAAAAALLGAVLLGLALTPAAHADYPPGTHHPILKGKRLSLPLPKVRALPKLRRTADGRIRVSATVLYRVANWRGKSHVARDRAMVTLTVAKRLAATGAVRSEPSFRRAIVHRFGRRGVARRYSVLLPRRVSRNLSRRGAFAANPHRRARALRLITLDVQLDRDFRRVDGRFDWREGTAYSAADGLLRHLQTPAGSSARASSGYRNPTGTLTLVNNTAAGVYCAKGCPWSSPSPACRAHAAGDDQQQQVPGEPGGRRRRRAVLRPGQQRLQPGRVRQLQRGRRTAALPGARIDSRRRDRRQHRPAPRSPRGSPPTTRSPGPPKKSPTRAA